MSLRLPLAPSPIVPVQPWAGLIARLTVKLWPDWAIDPFIVKLDAAAASATVLACTLAALRPASGSTVLLALGAAPALAEPLLPQAAIARQLMPAAATNVVRTNLGRPLNMTIS